jgi:hypothetical protein
MKSLQDLFNTVENYAFKVRSKGADGLVAWNELKVILPKKINGCDDLKWKINRIDNSGKPMTCLDEIYNYVHDDLHMRGEEDDLKSDNWEKYHFFLQLIRIPYKNPSFDLIRLCQIAYNLGQLRAVYDDKLYTPKVKNYFRINNLQDMNSYVDLTKCDDKTDYTEFITKINNIKQIKEIVLNGGSFNYYSKYLKYKNKYLILQRGGKPAPYFDKTE